MAIATRNSSTKLAQEDVLLLDETNKQFSLDLLYAAASFAKRIHRTYPDLD
jgi:hypothetical protein